MSMLCLELAPKLPKKTTDSALSFRMRGRVDFQSGYLMDVLICLVSRPVTTKWTLYGQYIHFLYINSQAV